MEKTNNRSILYLILIIVLLIGVIVGLGINYKINPENYRTVVSKNVNTIQYTSTNLGKTNLVLSSIKVPAIDNDGNGVITGLVVEAVPGTGKTLVDINSILFISDTQSSIRTAKEVAAKYTGKDLSKYDIIYHLDANATVISGPSAGAAMTIATISALENQKIKDNVMITGGIDKDGNITDVGGIVDKAKASKSAGAEIFLVPLTQSEETVYQDKESCRTRGLTKICNIVQVPITMDVQKEANIPVKEVSNISEAYSYFVDN
jgi:uncharacterized protein